MSWSVNVHIPVMVEDFYADPCRIGSIRLHHITIRMLSGD